MTICYFVRPKGSARLRKWCVCWDCDFLVIIVPKVRALWRGSGVRLGQQAEGMG